MIKSLLDTEPNVPMGVVKTFGLTGPKYEVSGKCLISPAGEWFLPIRVIESGEELEYPFAQFSSDPLAR